MVESIRLEIVGFIREMFQKGAENKAYYRNDKYGISTSAYFKNDIPYYYLVIICKNRRYSLTKSGEWVNFSPRIYRDCSFLNRDGIVEVLRKLISPLEEW